MSTKHVHLLLHEGILGFPEETDSEISFMGSDTEFKNVILQVPNIAVNRLIHVT